MKAATDRLAKARVHICGTGRIGTHIAMALHESGVGEISCNDPQRFESEQLEVCAFSRRSDLGREKVYVLERFLDGRPSFVFHPIAAPNESPKVQPYLERADLIVSCANNLAARLHLERMAVRLSKPSIQVCVQDGRNALGGLVSLWAPGADDSCFGCLFPDPGQRFRRGEVLAPTVTRLVASVAAHLVVEILTGRAVEIARSSNVFRVDIGAYKLEPMLVRRRTGCQICGDSRHGEK